MISYWSDVQEIYENEGLTLIIGKHNHKNKNPESEKCLGIHWEGYPQSRGILSPCVIPKATRTAILAGLLEQAVSNRNSDAIEKINKAIKYLG